MRYLTPLFTFIVSVLVACQIGQSAPSALSLATGQGLATSQAGIRALALLPSPTPFLLDLSPFDGNSDVSVYGGNSFSFQANPANLEVSRNPQNGQGIGRVDMQIVNANGVVIDTHREGSTPYCYYNEPNNDCADYLFELHGYRWPGGTLAADGIYFARALAFNSAGNKVRIGEQAFMVDLSNTHANNLSLGIDELGKNYRQRDENNGNEEYYDSLEFHAGLYGVDMPIDRVVMSIVAPDGTIVHSVSDSTEPYCAFGDAGSNNCQTYTFTQHNNRWPSGAPIRNAMYTFRLVAYSNGTAVAGDAEAYTVLAPQALSVPPNNSTTNTSNSGSTGYNNFAILADGSQDVSSVNGQLVFRTVAGSNGTDGDNIARIDMYVLDAYGSTVHQRSEASPKFCAFGGNEECNPFVFAWENYRWQNGAPIQNNAQYTLYATIYFRDNRTPVNLSRTITVHW